MNAGAEDPKCEIVRLSLIKRTPARGTCDYGRQKRLRRLDHMRKSDGPVGSLYRVELAGNWFAPGDALQKFRRFFHRKLYAKSGKVVAASL